MVINKIILKVKKNTIILCPFYYIFVKQSLIKLIAALFYIRKMNNMYYIG